MKLDNFVPESVNHQKMNCVEEDEFLDTHIDHTILKGCGKLQKRLGGRSSGVQEEGERRTVVEMLMHI